MKIIDTDSLSNRFLSLSEIGIPLNSIKRILRWFGER